jgi:hypothetical protein
MASTPDERLFFDAGLFIGALLGDDHRHTDTYDIHDWKVFAEDGIRIAGPESMLSSLT